MPDRLCAVAGCKAFPDAAWHLCADHLAKVEADAGPLADIRRALPADRPDGSER